MSPPRVCEFSFTKLVVGELDALTDFYCAAFDLHAVSRVHSEIGPEPIDEIMLSPDPAASFGTLVLLKFPSRAAPAPGGSLLGFTTRDLDALLRRVLAAGGKLHAPTRAMPEHGIRVAFTTDPEGNLAELVETTG